jgi:hypothetical protein
MGKDRKRQIRHIRGNLSKDREKEFRYRELNPGHLGESQVS